MAQCLYPWPALQGCERISTFFLCFGTMSFCVQNRWGSSTPSWNSLTRCDEQLTHMLLPFGTFSLWWWVTCAVVSLFGELHTCYHLFEDFGKETQKPLTWGHYKKGLKAISFLLLCARFKVAFASLLGWVRYTLQTQKGPLKHLLWLGRCSCPCGCFSYLPGSLSPQVTSVLKNRWPAKDDCAREMQGHGYVS